MDILTETLGSEGAKRFLIFALPHIQDRHQKLLNCIYQQQWDLAANYAHTIRGTLNLYGVEDIIWHLDKLIEKDTSITSLTSFQYDLQFLLAQTEDYLNHCISTISYAN